MVGESEGRVREKGGGKGKGERGKAVCGGGGCYRGEEGDGERGGNSTVVYWLH